MRGMLMRFVRKSSRADDDAVLSDLDMVPDGGCLDDRIGADVDVVSDLHGIVVEVASVCFVWWSESEDWD